MTRAVEQLARRFRKPGRIRVVPSGCHEWQGALKNGYGILWCGGRPVYAHRVAFRLAYGRWPDPCALHECDNTRCVNVSHLYEGTQADNAADREGRGRGNHRWGRDGKFIAHAG